ncbi:hypothetical protein TB1_006471 [Malus domestica]
MPSASNSTRDLDLGIQRRLSNIGSMVENIESDTSKLINETDEQSNSSEDQITESNEDSTADNKVISLVSIGSTLERAKEEHLNPSVNDVVKRLSLVRDRATLG